MEHVIEKFISPTVSLNRAPANKRKALNQALDQKRFPVLHRTL